MRRFFPVLRRVMPVSAALLVSLSCGGCASFSVSMLAPVAVRVGRPFVIAESPPWGWGVLSHPRLIKVSDDLIILLYYVGGDSKNWNNPKAKKITMRSPAISRDGGKTWVFGEENLDPLVAEYAYYFGYDAEMPSFAILGVHTQAIETTTKGELEAGPWGVDVHREGFESTGPWHRCARMSDGTLVGVSYADKVRYRGKLKNKFHLLTSTDTGHSWTVQSTVATPEDTPWAAEWPLGYQGPHEPAVTVLPNDDILCVARVGTKTFTLYETAKEAMNMLQARSDDGGKTWDLKQLNIEGVYPKLYEMESGVLALAFGRPGNNLVFSVNGGVTWGAEVALTPPNARTSGYCDLVEVRPGRLLVVFDVNRTDLRGFWLWEPKLANGLYGVFVDVIPLSPLRW